MGRCWILCPLTLVLLAGCGGDQISASPRSPTTGATVSSGEETIEEGPRCSDVMPFEPTYLPQGFERDAIRGPAPGGRPLDSRNQIIFHYRGNDRAIEVRRPGTLFVELAQRDDAPTIHVLGEDTASFGPIEPGGDDFIVFVTYPRSADPDDQCSWFSLNEVGVSLAELKQVAEGLRQAE